MISDNLFVRNYITTNAFYELEKEHECSYLFSEKITLGDTHGKSKTSIYRVNLSNQVLHLKIFNLLMCKYQNLSSSFKFRVMRLMKLNLDFPVKDSLLIKAFKLPVRLSRWVWQHVFFYFLANKFVLPIALNWYKQKLEVNEDIKNHLEATKPDLIVFPSSAFDPDGNDLLIISKSLGIPTLYLIDNWDNLSSKSIFWIKPTHISVWGQQSLNHAISIQGFEASQVKCIGTPRYDEYFRLRNEELKNHFNFRYILFVGTALSFDEVGALRQLNAIIKQNSDYFGNIKIVYRPHPWRQGYDTIKADELEYIIIDPQVSNAYSAQSFSTLNQPDLSYYPSLIKNAEFVMGGLTSMLIEALIFNKRYLAFVYDDGKNLTSQHNALKYFMHFQGLENIEELTFCHDISDMEKLFIQTWDKRNDSNIDDLDEKRRYFYYDDELPYSHRLLNLCNEVIKSNQSEKAQ